jgi:hypothetical protein
MRYRVTPGGAHQVEIRVWECEVRDERHSIVGIARGVSQEEANARAKLFVTALNDPRVTAEKPATQEAGT